MKKIWRAVAGYWRTTDRWLLFFCFAASGISILFLCGVYNSGMMDGTSKIVMQAGASLMGLAVALVISTIDYNALIKWWKLYVPICVIVVLFTMVWGVTRGDNTAWLYITMGGRTFSMQPSELLKISFITTFALHLDKVKEDMNRLPTLLLLCLHGGAHVLLIQMQGDSGSALVFLAIFLVMLFFAGVGWKYIASAGIAVFLAAPLLWLWLLTDDQKMRILVLLNPERDADYAFQQLRGAIALGTGGLQGTGIFAGRHVPVPEAYNDFIFSFIGEASGFIGALGVILLLSAIAFKFLYNSSAAKDDTGRLICVGAAGMMLTQMFINLGMCLRLLPVIGVTLPFISAGGTSVLSMYCALGLVLSTYRHSGTTLFYAR